MESKMDASNEKRSLTLDVTPECMSDSRADTREGAVIVPARKVRDATRTCRR
jgi:hypothetical protein